ncbi:hypothetical protein K435DRAFT_36704 [Dendrothele bispora CBS 962.96]|uniref:Uncharacterized protein n=1 Tax=Dendrothele bispora (strain CBS 962.96) TaxID=1314807 RepID=A0A4S8M777_DENBC|nr:hypothetical protein K435DRAFT_36704 [Dendrothele bispora CBS 962.96]
MYRRTRWGERTKYIFIALCPYLNQENFYRRKPWIDVFVSDDELPISDVWDSYLPSGSRYGRRQDVNSGATAAVGRFASVTATAKKIWDDPTYYYILLEENDGQPGEGLTDDARSGLEGADVSTGNGRLNEVMTSSEYEAVNEESVAELDP